MSRDFLKFGAGDFSFKNSFQKVFQNRLFLALASRSGSGVARSDAVVPSSIVPVCNLVFIDRKLMSASRLLGGAAACVIFLFCAAGHRKPYWNGCIYAAIGVCHEIFSV